MGSCLYVLWFRHKQPGALRSHPLLSYLLSGLASVADVAVSKAETSFF